LVDEDAYSYHRHLARLTFVFHVLAAGVLFGVGLIAEQLGPIDLWYGRIRFRGWAENPNQMALAMAAMPFLGWWLLQRSRTLVGRTACLLGIALCIVVGLATLSDGLRVAWAASVLAIGILSFYRVTMRGRSRWLVISHLIIPALIVIIGLFYGGAVVDHLSGLAEATYEQGDQGEKRFTLWLHGIEAIRESPLFGFGPGPFSGYGGPFEGSEAHNTFIDWGMSTGLAGVLLYVAILWWTLWHALRSRELTLVGMLVAVIVFSIFGYVLRQPDFWLALVLILTLSERGITLRQRQARHSRIEPSGQARRSAPSGVRSLEQTRPL